MRINNPSKFATRGETHQKGGSKFKNKQKAEPKTIISATKKVIKKRIKSEGMLDGITLDYNSPLPTDGDLDYMESLINDIISNNCSYLRMDNNTDNQKLDYIERIIYEALLELNNPQGYNV